MIVRTRIVVLLVIGAVTARPTLAAPPDQAARARAKATHWAYQNPVRPELPSVKQSGWVANPIDAFVLARLEAEGLRPAPPADRETLLRRIHLDLTGLPPSIEQVDAFLADESSDAYERAVDRLLASPAYGERWARFWLDLARYADTNGYEKDARRTIWPYRDWVINAFNRDLPFDQFTTEQLAGDLLPNATLAQKIATGFHRNTMTNTEGGVDPEEYRTIAVVDRVNTTMQVWMGTTFGCTQCHAHKYDPFEQAEYYQVLAFFNSTADRNRGDDAPFIEVPTREQLAKRKTLTAEIAPLEKTLATQTPELAAAQAKWEAHVAAVRTGWEPLAPVGAVSARGATLRSLDDGSLRAEGNRPQTDTYTVVINTTQKAITAFRLEALSDDALPEKGPGRDDGANFVLSEFRVTAAPLDGTGEPKAIELHHATADYAQRGFDVARAIDGKLDTGWAVGGKPGQPRVAVFEAKQPVGFDGGTTLTFTLEQRHGERHTLGRLRLSTTTVAGPVQAKPVPDKFAALLDVSGEKRSDKQKNDLAAYYRSVAPALQPTRDRVAALKKALPRPATTLVMQELDKPRETHILLRGNFLAKGDKVSAGVPATLHPMPKDRPMNRLGFARWLVNEDNPLVGRVIMNRFWTQFFGRGLVTTVEDFGTQGSPPSHPKLLDWLATEFPRQGWRMKAMQKLMVMSATYRQSSHVTSALRERDPYNRLLARGPRFRLPAETIRDQALAIAGLLSGKMFGSSVMPPQPDGVWQVVYSGDKWVTSKGEDKYRRGLYTFWRRTSPHPAMTTFDAPSREVCTEKRPRTNTPLQALVLMNDPAYVEAAQALARRVMTECKGDVATRIAYGLRLCLTRKPHPDETAPLATLFHGELAHFRKDPDAARAMATQGNGDPPAELDVPELAAWTVVANVLLNLDEVITKQ